jgi:hypothetical protein
MADETMPQEDDQDDKGLEVEPKIDPDDEPVATETEDDDPESLMGEEVEP